ncbi:MAG: hypothetical protein FJ147_15075 [Deltaproteobacteria bacterium]|nr:hypothetical protein [Deltaproteobacteria bacterium]
MKNRAWLTVLLVGASFMITHAHCYAEETIQDLIPQRGNLTAPPPPAWSYPIVESLLTCDQAKRVSTKAVERLGYKVTTFTPATDNKGGVLQASRSGLWGDKEPVTVTLTCGTEGVRIDASPDVPPCEQGNRIARVAVERRGFKVTEFTPAAIGKPGIIKGTKEGEKPGVITISCEPNHNVMMETSMDGPLARHKDFYITISNFYQGFYAVFKGERGMVAAEAIPASDNQMHVAMKPLNRTEMKMAFGAESKTYLPVQVEIANRTKRSYQLDVTQVMLLSPMGVRVKPLAESKGGFPAQALASQTIAPGTSIKGYLYYPAGAYTGARGSLTEEKSQEREGFDVQF